MRRDPKHQDEESEREEDEEEEESDENSDISDRESLHSSSTTVEEEEEEEEEEKKGSSTKQFFTQLGTLVAVFGVTMETTKTVMDDISAQKFVSVVLNGCLLLFIHLPTLVAMLIVLLKERMQNLLARIVSALKRKCGRKDILDDDAENSDENSHGMSVDKQNEANLEKGIVKKMENGTIPFEDKISFHGVGVKTKEIENRSQGEKNANGSSETKEHTGGDAKRVANGNKNRRTESMYSSNASERKGNWSDSVSEASEREYPNLRQKYGKLRAEYHQKLYNPDNKISSQYDSVSRSPRRIYDGVIKKPSHGKRRSEDAHYDSNDSDISSEHIFRQYFNIENRSGKDLSGSLSHTKNEKRPGDHYRVPESSHNDDVLSREVVRQNLRNSKNISSVSKSQNSDGNNVVSKTKRADQSKEKPTKQKQTKKVENKITSQQLMVGTQAKPFQTEKKTKPSKSDKSTTKPPAQSRGISLCFSPRKSNVSSDDEGNTMPGRDNPGFQDNGINKEYSDIESERQMTKGTLSDERRKKDSGAVYERDSLSADRIGSRERSRMKDSKIKGGVEENDGLGTTNQLPKKKKGKVHSENDNTHVVKKDSKTNRNVVEVESDEEMILWMIRQIKQERGGDLHSDQSQEPERRGKVKRLEAGHESRERERASTSRHVRNSQREETTVVQIEDEMPRRTRKKR